MSDTSLPETMETHGALYKSIGVTLAVASGKWYTWIQKRQEQEMEETWNHRTRGGGDEERHTFYHFLTQTLSVLGKGVFIGSSYVFKKKGLLDSNAKSGKISIWNLAPLLDKVSNSQKLRTFR